MSDPAPLTAEDEAKKRATKEHWAKVHICGDRGAIVSLPDRVRRVVRR